MSEDIKFSRNDRMMQTLAVLAFKGPLSIRNIAREIANNTGENPESVRVLLYRGFSNLINFGLVKKINMKKVDITPLGLLVLMFSARSDALRVAILYSLERRFSGLLKHITLLYASTNRVVRGDGVEVKVGKRVEVAVDFSNLLNMAAFNPVDFSSMEAFTKSILGLKERFPIHQAEIIGEAVPIIIFCRLGQCDDASLIKNSFPFIEEDFRIDIVDAYAILTIINFAFKHSVSPALFDVIPTILEDGGRITLSLLKHYIKMGLRELENAPIWTSAYAIIFSGRADEVEDAERVRRKLATAMQHLGQLLQQAKA
ncbi:MAG: hypothetical protein QXW45_06915 [Thermosphaera sp.]